jgi:hypothetical protein
MTLRVFRSIETVVLQRDQSIDPRTENYNGRQHIVVPMIALREMALSGALSGGDYEFISRAEIAASINAWNGRPLTNGHPQVDNAFVSANTPQVSDTFRIGTIFNAELVDEYKLRVEAWIDVQRTQRIGARRILDRIQRGELVEVSTGFFSDIVPRPGTWRDRVYTNVIENIQPDHIAILGDGVTGACSVEDGCGIPRLNQEGRVDEETDTVETEATETPTDVTPMESETSCECGGSCARLNEIVQETYTRVLGVLEARIDGIEEKFMSESKTADAADVVDTQQNVEPRVNASESDAPAPGPQTLEEWLNTVPVEVRQQVLEGQQARQSRRDGMIERVLADKTCAFTREDLEGLDTEMLTKLSTLARGNEDYGALPSTPRINTQGPKNGAIEGYAPMSLNAALKEGRRNGNA